MNQGKNVGFNFFQVRCAHKSGDVLNFIIIACRISSRLKWYKNYKNRIAKVIIKNKMSRFYGSLCRKKPSEHRKSMSVLHRSDVFKNTRVVYSSFDPPPVKIRGGVAEMSE